MTMSKGKTNNEFDLKGLSFNQIVLIKKACAAYGTQGSSGATQIALELEEVMDNMTI